MRKTIVIILLTSILLSGCATATQTPASEVLVERTFSTEAPTVESSIVADTPTRTATSTSTSAPTPTHTATGTPTPTQSPTPTYTPTPGTPGVDRVVAFNPGPGAKADYRDPEALLGDPDLIEDPCCRGIVQLGRGGSVLLAFTDNTVVDGPGPDFQVYGESARDDYLLIEVSADGQAWQAYPKVSESAGGLDLADVGLARVVYVRLTDLQPATSTGAEVDAVVALHNGPGQGDDLLDLPEAVARGDLILREGPHTSMTRTGQVSEATKLNVVGRSQSAGWAKVGTEDGESGWCLVTDLALNVSLSDYSLAQAPPTPTNTPKPTPRPTATPEPRKSFREMYENGSRRKTGVFWDPDVPSGNPAYGDQRFGGVVGRRGGSPMGGHPFMYLRPDGTNGVFVLPYEGVKYCTVANFVRWKQDEPSIAVLSFGYDNGGEPINTFEVKIPDEGAYCLIWRTVPYVEFAPQGYASFEPGDNVEIIFRDFNREQVYDFVANRTGRPAILAILRVGEPYP